MSSPLAQFRKHQKVLLAVFGVGIIIAFVVLPNAMKMLDNRGGGGAGGEEVALTWIEGDIDRAELRRMVETYKALTQFLRETAEETQNQGGQPRALSLRPDPSGSVERLAVQTMLRAKKAEQLGMVVSEKMVTKYISDWTDGNKLSIATRTNIFKRAGMTEDQLYAILTRELMAQKLMIMASFAHEVGTPAQLYEYAGRLSREAQFELLPIHVASFLDRQDNPDPSDEQLRDFYKQWKDRVKYPDSPNPGLKQPYRASLEYLRADLNQFVEQAKAKVTEEEIQEYYDEKKDLHYRVDTFGGFDEPLPPNPDPVLPLPANPDPVLPPAGDGASKPAGQFNVQDAAADGGAKTKTADKKADPKQTADAKKDDSKSIDKPNKDNPAPGEKLPGEKLPDEKKPEDKQPEVKYEPLSKHRDDIREQLGRRGAATEIVRIFGEISQLGSMTTYPKTYEDWWYSDSDGGEPTGDPPPRPPLEQIAEQYGLSHGVTGMLSVFEANESEGFAEEFRVAFSSRSAIRMLAVQSTADDKLALLKARLAAQLGEFPTGRPYLADSEQNGYLCWKIKEKKTHVPDLSAIRETAVAAWKMEKARELARQRAEKLATEARENGGKLKLAFRDEEAQRVIQPDPFSWLTLATDMQALRIWRQFRQIPELNNKIDDGIKYIDAQFLEKIFALEPGEVGIAFDQPQEIVYVVRMDSIDPADSQQLLTHLDNARYISNAESYVVRRDWDKALESEFKVVWAPERE